MKLRHAGGLTLHLGLFLLGGCSYPYCCSPDRVERAAGFIPAGASPAARQVSFLPNMQVEATPAAAGGNEESQAPDATSKPRGEPNPDAKLQAIPVPPEVPGADLAPITLKDPVTGKPLSPAERQRAVERLFPPLPSPGENPVPVPTPERPALHLHDLEDMALANSPVIRQAVADVGAARGAAIQAAAYPNPIMGFEPDELGQGDLPHERVTPGQLGGFVTQTIKTKGKLGLARASAEQDVRNAEFALRRTQFDLMAQVRGGYFAVLAAQENMRVALAFTRYTEAIYRIQVGQLQAGEVAAYEPLQFRALATQTCVALAQARHRYVGAWRQLAAVLGRPALPPAPLAGRIDMPIPIYRYEDVAERTLARHTDVLTARATLERARTNLRLAQVTPYPDIDVRVLVQKDYTAEPHNVMTSVQIGGAIPVWNRNQGHIRQAEAQLERAAEEEHRVRDELARRLAEAFERYHLNRELIAPYRGTVLPDQVRVLNGVFERYLTQGKVKEIMFLDITTAEQNLVTSLTSYLQALAAQWQAVVDIAALAQTDDLFQPGRAPLPTECVPALPDLDQVLPLPCGDRRTR